MVYAPIVIPTLCRFQHIKKLIESLQKNSWAKYTELYIGIDYPPHEQYRDGYDQVCKYFKAGVNGFLNVNVYFHKANLGSYENALFLLRKVREKYDRYIFTEDDNEFSPNFLEYMDKMLEYYVDDPKIIAISGHNPLLKTDLPSNALLCINTLFDGWGTGYWIKKMDKIYNDVNMKYLGNIMGDLRSSIRLRKKNRNLFFYLVEAVVFQKGAMFGENGKLYIIDQVLSIYMIENEKYMLCPIYSKVRNRGDDGTGEHGSNDKKWCHQIIDNNEYYNMPKNAIIISEQDIKRQLREKYYWDWYMNIRSFLVWICWYLKNIFKRL